MERSRRLDWIFAAECAIYGVLSMIWYRNILFRCLPLATYGESRVILWTLVVGFGALGVLMGQRRQGSTMEFARFLVLAYGVYTAIAYAGIARRRMLAFAVVYQAFFVVYGVYLLRCAAKHRRRRQYVIRHLRVCSTVFAVGVAALMVSLGISRLFGNALISASGPVREDGREQWTMEENMDAILKLKEETWSGLSAQERLNVLQVVVNIEASSLGLPNGVRVGADNLSGSTQGEYSDATRAISISLTHLMESSARDVLNTCCHEVYHSYQHRLVDAYREAPEALRGLELYRQAATYDWEFEHYQRAKADPELYAGQLCESDSRAYAACASAAYYSRMEAYELQHGSGAESGDADSKS